MSKCTQKMPKEIIWGCPTKEFLQLLSKCVSYDFCFFSHCVYTRWHALFIGTDLSTPLYCWPPFISSLTLLTLAGVWQLNTLYHYNIRSRTDVELIAAFLFPIFEVTHSWPSLSPVGFFCSSSLSLGHLLNVPLQVCLDSWNEMWFLLTSVTTNIYLGVGGMSFAFGGKKKKPWAIQVKPLTDFLLGCFTNFQAKSKECIWRDIFDCLDKMQKYNKLPNFYFLMEVWMK